jgi:hypothetical protein
MTDTALTAPQFTNVTARRGGMPRLESILLHSASGDGYNDLTPLLAI